MTPDELLALADAATEFAPGYYVTAGGRIFSDSGWRGRGLRELSQQPNTDGYMRVRCVVDGKRKSFMVHRLVAEAFLPYPSGGQQIRHLDGCRSNNAASNLRWGTPVENAADRELHGRTARGERNGQASLSDDVVRAIRFAYAGGESQYRIAAEFGIAQQTVSRIVRRERWAHVD